MAVAPRARREVADGQIVAVRAGGVLLAAGYLLERKRKGMFHKAQH